MVQQQTICKIIKFGNGIACHKSAFMFINQVENTQKNSVMGNFVKG